MDRMIQIKCNPGQMLESSSEEVHLSIGIGVLKKVSAQSTNVANELITNVILFKQISLT